MHQNNPFSCEHGNDKRTCAHIKCVHLRLGDKVTMGVDMSEEGGDKTVERTSEEIRFPTEEELMAGLIDKTSSPRDAQWTEKEREAIATRWPESTVLRKIGGLCKHGVPAFCKLCEIEALQHQVNTLTTATAEMNDKLAEQEATIKRLRRKKRKWKQRAAKWSSYAIRG